MDADSPSLHIACIGAGYVGGATMAVLADRCPHATVHVLDVSAARVALWNTPVDRAEVSSFTSSAAAASSSSSSSHPITHSSAGGGGTAAAVCAAGTREDDVAAAEAYLARRLPLSEPGLARLLLRCRGRNLFFTTDAAEALCDTDIVFIAVGTPTMAAAAAEEKRSSRQPTTQGKRSLEKRRRQRREGEEGEGEEEEVAEMGDQSDREGGESGNGGGGDNENAECGSAEDDDDDDEDDSLEMQPDLSQLVEAAQLIALHAGTRAKEGRDEHTRRRVVVVQKCTVPAGGDGVLRAALEEGLKLRRQHKLHQSESGTCDTVDGDGDPSKNTVAASSPCSSSSHSARHLIPAFPIVSNPEFLSEGSAVADLESPSRVVIAGADSGAVQLVASLYLRWVPAARVLTLPSAWAAEAAKLAANAFLAQRVASINAIASLCERSGRSAGAAGGGAGNREDNSNEDNNIVEGVASPTPVTNGVTRVSPTPNTTAVTLHNSDSNESSNNSAGGVPDVLDARRVLISDPRIGSLHLQPSLGFGGPCLRKDLCCLAFLCRRLGLREEARYWEAVVRLNDTHTDRFTTRIVRWLRLTRKTVGDSSSSVSSSVQASTFNSRLPQQQHRSPPQQQDESDNVTNASDCMVDLVGVLGFAFKGGTGDARNSPAARVCARLLLSQSQLHLRLYDPAVPPAAALEALAECVLSLCLSEPCQGGPNGTERAERIGHKRRARSDGGGNSNNTNNNTNSSSGSNDHTVPSSSDNLSGVTTMEEAAALVASRVTVVPTADQVVLSDGVQTSASGEVLCGGRARALVLLTDWPEFRRLDYAHLYAAMTGDTPPTTATARKTAVGEGGEGGDASTRGVPTTTAENAHRQEETGAREQNCRRPVALFDGRRIVDVEEMQRIGFEVFAVGRPNPVLP